VKETQSKTAFTEAEIALLIRLVESSNDQETSPVGAKLAAMQKELQAARNAFASRTAQDCTGAIF